ncbi:hypothetical protein CHH28_03585 [Bacterioplanes sanyensis]|uniref:Uncharacterized protein n=1 Tax=Bacterioplanes sanyensis TaxID=1249553 RepID=A0A222FHB2_9GAMM|nr:hypothetical protein CHH28_03585 [Bacterioplanes sanyensis]
MAVVFAAPGAIIAVLGLINWEGYGFSSLLFFLFSGVLYFLGRNMRHDYEKIGPTVVIPDPLPAVIGHELGGHFMLAAKPRNDLTLKLSCTHTYSSGSSDNSSKMVVHQQEMPAYLEPQGDGVQKVSFLFQLPEDKPESDSPEYRGTISWELRATGLVTNDTKVPGTQITELIEFDRSWTLPVLSQAYASALGLTPEGLFLSNSSKA